MEHRRFRFESVLSYAVILCLLILSRMVFAPLLLRVEQDLGLSRAVATSFFLALSIGYATTMVLSGFVASRVPHRDTILVATAVDAAGLVLVALSRSLWLTFPALFLVGAATGLYVPSGVASIYALFDRRERGKAIGIHEVGASASFVLAPLLVALIGPASWRLLLVCMAATTLGAGILHRAVGTGGTFHGQPPVWRNLRELFANPSFVVTVVLFGLMLGAGAGAFSVLPTFLVTERGMPERAVNLVISLSRLTGLPVAYLAGSLADRMSPRISLALVLALAGACTILTGLASGWLLMTALFVQPLLTGAFFPIAFALLPSITPPELRNVAVAMVVPVGYIAGGGVVPSILGMLGERGAFWVGFVVLGALLLAGLALIPLLRPSADAGGDT